MHIELKRICCPIDFSDAATHSLRYGLTLAQQFGAQLHLLHVVQDIMPTVAEPGMAILPSDELIRNLEAGAKEGLEKAIPEDWEHSVDLLHVVRQGLPFHEICRYAKQEEVDLIILGTHGRSGLAHFLMGSVAERVVRAAPCPVLTVRNPEHEFILPD
ncbi:Putative universal stress protein [Planctomycetes bacterium Pan216]|uniref:Universal stress protein n=1 Tax=Kolteria novifilia TaxID=2527975 RepID=A0A518BCM7_9BACT|nr:Putative universal stress protein [Planctomycetes bacterium Pan216]